MPSLFIDAERLRDLNSGLGQVCLHLGHELVRQRPADPAGGPWQLTFLVPKGQMGVFGDSVEYVEASWLQKLWISGHPGLGRPGLDQYNVWHCLHQDSDYLPGGAAKLILTIHDLNFLARADYSETKKKRKRVSLQRKIYRAAALTAVSDYTASEVRQHLDLPADKPLRVIHNGVAIDAAVALADETRPAFLADRERPYFLFVGVIHPKKNVHTLLPLLEAFPDYQLVLAGPDRHSYARHIREQAEKLGVADRLIMPGAVDEMDKWWLYAHCDAFLFPSLSEGFGLPVAEAMTFGKPIFSSKLTSLPEVGGKEAYYFENFEPEHMARTLHDGLHDFAQNPLRQERMKQRAAGFSWPNVAKQYWALYEKVAATGKQA